MRELAVKFGIPLRRGSCRLHTVNHAPYTRVKPNLHTGALFYPSQSFLEGGAGETFFKKGLPRKGLPEKNNPLTSQ